RRDTAGPGGALGFRVLPGGGDRRRRRGDAHRLLGGGPAGRRPPPPTAGAGGATGGRRRGAGGAGGDASQGAGAIRSRVLGGVCTHATVRLHHSPTTYLPPPTDRLPPVVARPPCFFASVIALLRRSLPAEADLRST